MGASAAKPGVGGGVWIGTATATCPTDASSALSNDFTSIGYVSADGVKRSISKTANPIKAWGGDVVAVTNEGKVETIKFKCLEHASTLVGGLAFGEATGNLTDGLTIKSKSVTDEIRPYVISTILSDNVHQRLVIPHGVITAIGDVSYKDNDLIGYDVTITAIVDSSGVTVYDYQKTITPST